MKNMKNVKIDLSSIELKDLKVLAESHAATMPENGATAGWNSCSRVGRARSQA